MNANIEYDCDSDKIIKLFNPEEKKFSNKRASYNIKKTRKGVVFNIEFADVNALRAIINSITSIIKVYETVDNIKIK